MKVTLLGAGAWGTAMAAQAAHHLQEGDVCLWSHNTFQLAKMQEIRENIPYLPGITLPSGLKLESDFSKAIKRLSKNSRKNPKH